LPHWLELPLAVLFLVHGALFLRGWFRHGRWRGLCFVGAFAALTIQHGLKGFDLPAPETELRAVAIGLTIVALADWIRERKA
jgi:hypothetical protein